MKLLGPVPREVVHRLRAENDELRLELASTTENLERQLELQKIETQKWRSLYEKSRQDSLKPYLEPTKASEQKRNSSRSTGLAKKPESRTTPLRDNQGKIMPNPRMDRVNFIRPTRASRAKKRNDDEVEVTEIAQEPDTTGWDIEFGTGSPEFPEYDESKYRPLFSSGSEDHDTCYCNRCMSIRDGTNAEQVETLRTHTRLRDRSFYKFAKSSVCVPYKVQKDLLDKAEVLAQKTLHDRIGRYWPGQEMLIYPHGEASISFGRGDLNMGVIPVDWDEEARYGGLCRSPGGHLWEAVEKVIALRNCKCHPRDVLFPSRIDSLLYTVQNLACELNDLEHAVEARGLRDQLQAYTKQSYDEIVMYEPLSNLPGNGAEWQAHHLATFDYVRKSYNAPLPPKASPDEVVKRAAHAWKGQYMGRCWDRIEAAREAKLAESNANKAELDAAYESIESGADDEEVCSEDESDDATLE